MSMTREIILEGRTIVVDEATYARYLARKQDLAERDRERTRDLRQARILPSEHRNATAKVTSSSYARPDTVTLSAKAQWEADKARRLHESFKTFTPPVPNLNRMHEAFNKLA